MAAYLGNLLAADSEHCGAADFTSGFGSRLAVLEGHFLWILSLSLFAAFNTVHCHEALSPPLSFKWNKF